MTKKLKGLLALGAGLAVVSSSAFAAGLNITIQDGVFAGGNPWWVNPNEDTETEPGTQTNQYWDIEAMVLGSNAGSPGIWIVGGYNFVAGRETYLSGDLFVDTAPAGSGLFDAYVPAGDGSITPGRPQSNGYHNISNSGLKWDYAVDLSMAGSGSPMVSGTPNASYGVGSTGQLVDLNSSSTLVSTWYKDFQESDPYRWASGSDNINPTESLAFKVFGTDTLTGDVAVLNGLITGAGDGTGGTATDNLVHIAMFVPLDVLSAPFLNKDLLLHYTMGCGNDQANGEILREPDTLPDGGATLALLGLGFAGLGYAGRRLRASR